MMLFPTRKLESNSYECNNGRGRAPWKGTKGKWEEKGEKHQEHVPCSVTLGFFN